MSHPLSNQVATAELILVLTGVDVRSEAGSGPDVAAREAASARRLNASAGSWTIVAVDDGESQPSSQCHMTLE
jgi:hypothetical protein